MLRMRALLSSPYGDPPPTDRRPTNGVRTGAKSRALERAVPSSITFEIAGDADTLDVRPPEAAIDLPVAGIYRVGETPWREPMRRQPAIHSKASAIVVTISAIASRAGQRARMEVKWVVR
jgi:hypothetical protein